MSRIRTVFVLLHLWTTISLNGYFVNGDIMRPFQQYCVETHNTYRAKHKVPNIKWSDTLEKEAKSWAKYLTESNNFFRGSKGENLYLSSNALSYSHASCKDAVDEFYSEESKYDYGRALLSHASERFTQLVWKNTLEIGAARLQRNDGKSLVVVRYNPPGNYNTTAAFKRNVLQAPAGTTSTQSSSAHVRIQIPLTVVAVLTAMFTFTQLTNCVFVA